jgi:hypothetical protein
MTSGSPEFLSVQTIKRRARGITGFITQRQFAVSTGYAKKISGFANGAGKRRHETLGSSVDEELGPDEGLRQVLHQKKST